MDAKNEPGEDRNPQRRRQLNETPLSCTSTTHLLLGLGRQRISKRMLSKNVDVSASTVLTSEELARPPCQPTIKYYSYTVDSITPSLQNLNLVHGHAVKPYFQKRRLHRYEGKFCSICLLQVHKIACQYNK